MLFTVSLIAAAIAMMYGVGVDVANKCKQELVYWFYKDSRYCFMIPHYLNLGTKHLVTRHWLHVPARSGQHEKVRARAGMWRASYSCPTTIL